MKYLDEGINNINYLEFILALITIFIIYGFKRITKAIPSTLVALLVVSLVVVFAGLNAKNIGEIPSGFPKMHLDMFIGFSISQVTPYIFTAISLALLGAIDSLLTSVVADNMTKTKHNSDKELIGQGIGNGIAAVFGGIPGAGATIRTVVNIDSGGKTKLSGMIAASLLLIILLVLGPYASQIPKAVLAGILITVGFGVMDYKGLKALPKMPKSDAIVLLTVLFLTVFWDLIFAVGIGLVISTLMFMKNMADITTRKSRVKKWGEELPWKDESEFQDKYKEEVFIKHLDGPVFFGFTSQLQALASQIPQTAFVVVIRMDNVPYMDQSGINAMDDILIDLAAQGKTVCLVGLQPQPKYLMERVDIIPGVVTTDHIFEDFHECNDWIKKNVSNIFPSA